MGIKLSFELSNTFSTFLVYVRPKFPLGAERQSEHYSRSEFVQNISNNIKVKG